MKIIIHASEGAHQREHAAAMASGLARHGLASELCAARAARPCDVAVIWGFKPPEFIARLKTFGARILVMERGYFPDRMQWTSMGWDGLNNRAVFPQRGPQVPGAGSLGTDFDGGARFRAHWPGLLQPWQDNSQGHALVCGQVPGDAAVHGVNLDAWAQDAVTQLRERPGSPGRIVYRPHPYLIRNGRAVNCPHGAELSTKATLAEDLRGARLCVTYNSNSGVEAVCAGIPTVTTDEGAMAWPVAVHSIQEFITSPLRHSATPDRLSWAHQLAWRQWRLEEIASGAAWEALKHAMPGLKETGEKLAAA